MSGVSSAFITVLEVFFILFSYVRQRGPIILDTGHNIVG